MLIGPSLRAQAKPFCNPSRVRHPKRCRDRNVAVMVLTESVDLPLGSPAGQFALPDPLTGKTVTLADVSGSKATLVMFICNHCPFVVLLKQAIIDLAKDYASQGVGIVAISSNSAASHPQDGPELMAKDAKELGYPFPYLYDESQDIAKAYKAQCTPEFYVFSESGLQYHGQFDDARPGRSVPVTGRDLRAALDAVLAGEPVPNSKASIGCNIKWHS